MIQTAFLRAIAAAPADPMPRLIYADWLGTSPASYPNPRLRKRIRDLKQYTREYVHSRKEFP